MLGLLAITLASLALVLSPTYPGPIEGERIDTTHPAKGRAWLFRARKD